MYQLTKQPDTMDISKELFGTIGWWVLPIMILAWIFREAWGAGKDFFHDVFTRNSKRNQERIEELHSEIIAVEQLLKDWYYADKPIGIAPTEVDPRAAVQKTRKLTQQIKEYRALFPKRLRGDLGKTVITIQLATSVLEHRQVLIDSGMRNSEHHLEAEKKAFDIVSEELPALREALEQRYRKILMVR